MNKMLASLLFLFMSCHHSGSLNSQNSRLIIKNVHVIPLTADTILHNMDVVIENGKIREIQPAIEQVPEDAVIEGQGKYLVPALVDCHVHYSSNTDLFR